DLFRAFFCQLLSALNYIHSQKIVHKDIKPGNIFVKPPFQIVLSTFRIAVKLDYNRKRSSMSRTKLYI
ncbi:hypothetical protein DM02DRAFT_472544, partial [Periconia macrospinosa]